jgi:hypothetical protein
MPSFLAIADFLRPQSLELGSTFIYGVRISFESFSGVIKDFNGIHANGFRYASENAPNSMKIEQWLSDSMQIEMSHTETDPLHGIETQAVVLNFRPQEAPSELFQIPPELKERSSSDPALRHSCSDLLRQMAVYFIRLLCHRRLKRAFMQAVLQDMIFG